MGSRRLPPSVDLREFFPTADDQGSLNASTAFAVLDLVGYFEGRTSGQTPDGSRLFLYQMALKWLGLPPNASVNFRTIFKALARFGTPPERYWPYEADRFQLDPTDPFLFSFRREYEALRYVHLDLTEVGAEMLQVVKAFLAAGFPSSFGFSVPSSLTAQADVVFHPDSDSVRGGQAVVAVGYDDRRRIASEKGALLFRCSWAPAGASRGTAGCPTATS